MSKLLVMTDLHIVAPGGRIIGLDPSDRLRAVLDHALRAHSDADRLILTGDLTHHGWSEEYAQLKSLLSDVPLPITYLLGNHDNREGFRAVFPEAEADTNGFVQTVVETDTHRLICLDTLDPENKPYHAGLLCDARMGWLRAQLERRSKPVVIFQHHPPMDVGFDGMDAIKLRNGAAQLDLLKSHDVAHLVAGHVHRTISGATAGTSWTIFKSPCHQMPMLLGPVPSSSSIDEPGAFGVLLLSEQGVVAHSEDVGFPGKVFHDGESATATA